MSDEISEKFVDAVIPCKHCVSQGGAESASSCSVCGGHGVVSFRLRVSELGEFQHRLAVALQVSTRGSMLEPLVDFAIFKLERLRLTGQLVGESWDTSKPPF